MASRHDKDDSIAFAVDERPFRVREALSGLSSVDVLVSKLERHPFGRLRLRRGRAKIQAVRERLLERPRFRPGRRCPIIK